MCSSWWAKKKGPDWWERSLSLAGELGLKKTNHQRYDLQRGKPSAEFLRDDGWLNFSLRRGMPLRLDDGRTYGLTIYMLRWGMPPRMVVLLLHYFFFNFALLHFPFLLLHLHYLISMSRRKHMFNIITQSPGLKFWCQCPVLNFLWLFIFSCTKLVNASYAWHSTM